jgi:TRAP-type C4-dicarboxylate transport system substrate-binding protein
MQTRRGFLKRTAIAGAVLGAATLPMPYVRKAGGAEPVTLKLHHFLGPTSGVTQPGFLGPWAERIASASDGRLVVEIYPSMQLGGSPPQLYDQARDRVADIVWTLPGYTPGRFPMTEAVELPFVAASAEATSQAFMQFANAHLRDEYADTHPLLFHCHAPGSFHMRGNPVARLEDVAGRTVRAPSRRINRALEAIGAVPVGMPVPQVPENLSKGVLDGALLPYEVAVGLKVPELVQSHTEVFVDRGFYTAAFLLTMNTESYADLPKDLQQVIDDNSGMAIAAEIGRVWDDGEAAAREVTRATGNTMIRLEADEIARWKQATEIVRDEWSAEMNDAGHDGPALVAEIDALVAEHAGG